MLPVSRNFKRWPARLQNKIIKVVVNIAKQCCQLGNKDVTIAAGCNYQFSYLSGGLGQYMVKLVDFTLYWGSTACKECFIHCAISLAPQLPILYIEK